MGDAGETENELDDPGKGEIARGILEEFGRSERNVPIAIGDGACAGRQHVFHPVRIRTVGEGNDEPVIPLREDHDGQVIEIAGFPAAMLDDGEGSNTTGKTADDGIEDEAVGAGNDPGEWHDRQPSGSARFQFHEDGGVVAEFVGEANEDSLENGMFAFDEFTRTVEIGTIDKMGGHRE